MARKVAKEEDAGFYKTPIVQAAEDYVQYKSEEIKLKKKLSGLNQTLKEYFVNAPVDEIMTETGQAVVYSVRTTVGFDENGLIAFAKENKIDIVRTKEYIDYDILESLIYNNKLTDEQEEGISALKWQKSTPVLNVRKRGE